MFWRHFAPALLHCGNHRVGLYTRELKGEFYIAVVIHLAHISRPSKKNWTLDMCESAVSFRYLNLYITNTTQEHIRMGGLSKTVHVTFKPVEIHHQYTKKSNMYCACCVDINPFGVLVLAQFNNFDQTTSFNWSTRSYSGHPFLCALVSLYITLKKTTV